MSWKSKIIQAKCFHLETYDGSAGMATIMKMNIPLKDHKSSLDIKNLVKVVI